MRRSKKCKNPGCNMDIHLPPGIDADDALDYCRRCRGQ